MIKSQTKLNLDAKWLGQLLLMQSVLYNLPTKEAIVSFVKQGVLDMPGVSEANYIESQTEMSPTDMVRFPLSVQETDHGVFLLRIDDPEKFEPYHDYINNFFFSIGVILEERYQRELNLEYQESIEQSLDQRTLQLLDEIKERKETEKMLKELTLQYELVMKASNDAFFDLNVKAQNISYSERWFTMLGYDPEELPHTYETWKSLLKAEKAEQIEQEVWEEINSKERWRYEFEMRRKDGSYAWILVRGMTVEIDSAGKPARILGTHTDITELKETEAELTRYRENLEQLVKDRTNELEETLAMLKKTQSQLVLFEKMGALRHLISGIAHEINNPLGAIEASNESLLKNIHRVTVNIDKLSKFLNSPFGKQFAKILDKSFSCCSRNASLTTRERRELCGNMAAKLESLNVPNAFEISNKLISMKIYDNIEPLVPTLRHEDALDKLFQLSEILDCITACDTIAIAVNKASKIVNALKHYIRKDTDLEGNPQPFGPVDIRECLDNVLLLFQNATRNFINVEVVYDDGLPKVMGSADQLNQVWTNLIQNSIHAMDGGGNLTIQITEQDGGILVKVQDDGCGMSKEIQDKIFEPLFTTKPAGEGTGLGMDIVYNIVVEDHKGTIEVESEPGVGTTISVWLPERQ